MMRDSRSAGRVEMCKKYAGHFFIVDASLLAGQKRHFNTVN